MFHSIIKGIQTSKIQGKIGCQILSASPLSRTKIEVLKTMAKREKLELDKLARLREINVSRSTVYDEYKIKKS